MARRLTRREYGLLALLSLVAVALLYFKQGGRLPGQGGAAAEIAGLEELGEPPQVHMDLLARNVASYDPGGRDLFKYYTPPPPPRAAPAVRPAPPPPKPRPEPPPVQANTTPPPVRSRKPPQINLTYLGFLGPKTNKIAVFEDPAADDILLVRAGEVIRDQFRVVDFGYQSITMGYIDKEFENETTELPQTAGSRR